KIDQLAPPIFIVVFARPIDRFTRRHLFPGRVERGIQFLRVQLQANLGGNDCVVVAYSFRQIKESADCVEEDCFEHWFREGEHPARPFAASLVRIFVEEECSARMLNVPGWQPALPRICARLSSMLPVEHNDPINEKILAISEDKIEGFVREPFQEIADRVGVAADVVMARIAAMLRAGTIRRVRQTLLATNLADGALVAWKVPET